MSEQNTCATCRWFKPTSPDQYMIGGWCYWRPPMRLRGLLWGAHNERIEEPEKEWCAEHRPHIALGEPAPSKQEE